MAKGRKTKTKTKTPKAQKAPKRSKYSRKKRKISRKRSLKGGMLGQGYLNTRGPVYQQMPPLMRGAREDGPEVDEFPNRLGHTGHYVSPDGGITWLYEPGALKTLAPSDRQLDSKQLEIVRKSQSGST